MEKDYIDNLGNVFLDYTLVGYYDTVEDKCYRLDDDSEITCPKPADKVMQPYVEDTRTYWWVLVLLVIAVAVFLIFNFYRA